MRDFVVLLLFVASLLTLAFACEVREQREVCKCGIACECADPQNSK